MPRDAADKAYLAAKTWSVGYGNPFRVPESLSTKNSQSKSKSGSSKSSDAKP